MLHYLFAATIVRKTQQRSLPYFEQVELDLNNAFEKIKQEYERN